MVTGARGPQSFWNDYQPYGLHKPKVIFTIHNLNYGQKKIAEAATACQRFTTVSPTYAFEVRVACGPLRDAKFSCDSCPGSSSCRVSPLPLVV